jgi:hypothetical protein
MKAIWTACILGAVAVSPVRAQFEPAKLVPETLRYRVLSGAVEVGSSTITITRDSVAGIIHIFESISGLFEQTAIITFRNDTGLQPLTTRVIISRDTQYHELQLRYDDNGRRVTGEVRRPPEFGGSRVIDLALPSGAADVYAAPHRFRAAPLVIGKTLQFPFFNALQNEEGVARAWVAKVEAVSVPAGNFECFRLEAFLGNSRLILNIDRQFPHRLIRQILPELEVKFELVKE